MYVATRDNKGQTPSKSSTTYWQYQGSTSQLYGDIDASSNNVVSGGGRVQINADGLQTYHGTSIQCYVGTNGEIFAGGGAVKLDSNGMRTYSGSSTLVTSIDTNGSYKGATMTHHTFH